MSGTSALYVGEVMHQRFKPQCYRFTYRVFSLLLDLEDVEAGFPRLRWLSHNRFNLLSVHDKDHAARDGSAWRPWLAQMLQRAGLEVPLGRVLLNAYPRVLGYQFNPLSVWYLHDLEGRVFAVLCEVSNTFGGFHHYLLHDHGNPLRWPFRAQADKVFHVSPFIDMPMRYHFRFNLPAETLAVVIRETERELEGEPLVLLATHVARRKPLNDRELLKQVLAVPFLTLKVIVLIHWQALKIALRGGRLFPSPPKPKESVSVCPANSPPP